MYTLFHKCQGGKLDVAIWFRYKLCQCTCIRGGSQEILCVHHTNTNVSPPYLRDQLSAPVHARSELLRRQAKSLKRAFGKFWCPSSVECCDVLRIRQFCRIAVRARPEGSAHRALAPKKCPLMAMMAAFLHDP